MTIDSSSSKIDAHSRDQLFVTILRLASKTDDGGLIAARENFVTECLAATLRADGQLMIRFLQRLSPAITIPDDFQPSDETQHSFADSRCCIDMLFNAAPDITIGVENKLWSQEGTNQLKKYLDGSDFTKLAFIAAYDANIDPEVLEHERYLRPSARAHFGWADFWDVHLAKTGLEPRPSGL
jgi:hypothetical protein